MVRYDNNGVDQVGKVVTLLWQNQLKSEPLSVSKDEMHREYMILEIFILKLGTLLI